MFTFQSLLLRVHFIPFHHLSYFSSFMLSDFHCFHTCTQLRFTYTITFPFTFSFTVTIIFLFSLLIMEKMPAFILVILQLAFVNWWMKSMIWIALFKNFTRDKLGMEALTQPYFYKTVHSPLWLGLVYFFSNLFSILLVFHFGLLL